MRYPLILFSILSIQFAYGQLYDRTWVCGGSNPGKIVFDTPIDTSHFSTGVAASYEWACISDRNGNFQFFTEGVNVYSYDGLLMANGFQLADNSVNNTFNFGLPDDQNVLILPKRDQQYYIIYQSQSDAAFANHPWYFADRLYYAVVDMGLQNGKGEVIEKKVEVNTGLFMDGKLTTCQHANGRDWWLVQRGYNSNRYLIYLITPDTISFIREQFIGAISQEPDAIGQSAFSPDGTKYASITGNSPLIILDFDRCQGTFSNPQHINIPMDTFMFYGQQKIEGGGGNGLCFSPNNRFIYVNSLYLLRQYDLLSNPIDSSEQVIFFWTDSNETHGQFDEMHLGPNGRVYVADYQGFTKALHVINYPDSAGLSCGFVKWGLPVTTNDARVIPNMVHFRMGALSGSGCDTISTSIPQSPELNQNIRVFPNPASDMVEIDLLSYSQYHPQQQFYLYDVQGKLVKQVALPYLSAQMKVNDLPAGVYHWKMMVKEKIQGEGKLEVVR
jgi:hypothetical protein